MSKPGQYRPLNEKEKIILQNNGCSCDEWGKILVMEGFNAHRISGSTFSGNIKLGRFDNIITYGAGVKLETGIRQARIHNCEIGSNVLIENIGEYIANYIIEDDVVIFNSGRIFVEGISSFGNGVKVSVMNEIGSRSVKIWDRLSSHEAYIMAHYRYKKKALEVIDGFSGSYIEEVTSDKGIIHNHTKISNCGLIKNVNFGPYSEIEGTNRLIDGSINSCNAAPVYIGPGVIMEHFIVCSGTIVSDSTIVDRCFIGQGCTLKKNFTAENSLFFANCEAYQGEACSIFAGPYTVSHHKSSLLIAGMFSFMNAGSGFNQSNHMYKLGPVHQGVVERGSKAASDSYLLWPSRIGSFSLIRGRHPRNIDTSTFPFSYIIENNNDSVLVPGVNLGTIGTFRDAGKWPVRDKRRDPDIIDKVVFSLLGPYTIQRMIIGRNILRELWSDTVDTDSFIGYNNMKIKSSSLNKGINYYQLGINIFLGGALIKRLENAEFHSIRDIRKLFESGSDAVAGSWVDLAGLIAPKQKVEDILDSIEMGRIVSLSQMEAAFENLYHMYDKWEWNWTYKLIEEEEGKNLSAFTVNDVISIIGRWKDSVADLGNILRKDAEKEFSQLAMTGYGIDGDEKESRTDFENVRGGLESNETVSEILDHIKERQEICDYLIARVNRVKQ